MNLQLSGQVAVVVGGASGIGRAIAAELARAGAGVAILDRSPGVVETAKGIQAAAGPRVTATVVDVTDYAAMRQAAGDVISVHGRCDHRSRTLRSFHAAMRGVDRFIEPTQQPGNDVVLVQR